MNKNIVLLSTILLGTNSIVIDAKDASTNDVKNNVEIQKKVTKTKESTALKTGDVLNLSEFTGTNSGIIYKIVKKGTGEKPVQGENLVVHYSGYLTGSDLINKKDLKKNKTVTVTKKFDSSLDRNMPFNFKLGARQVITGWEISLADMKIGETRIVILPAHLAYGNRATSQIPADSPLIFEITLIKAS
ncbi:MAG: FKBP-type peptidyl-prolyl cis-trans isomerase [Candidatus Dependentiae bacterium]|nr:FKBP-type peptidyl-prolyl cis-trans isomerase [Candidatus Dependentiae bacterium]